MRRTLSLIHRYVGLTMTIFLVIVGLTGSVIAFQRELDRWLNPSLLVVKPSGHPALDPFALQALANAADPRLRVDFVPLHLEPEDAFVADAAPRTDPATGKPYELPFNQISFNPYTGEKLGTRQVGDVTLRPEGLIPFLYRLHYSLALPEASGRTGSLILGIVALLWTIDCFVGFYLTLPARRRAPDAGQSPRSAEGRRGWWQRWKGSWGVRWRGGTYKVNYDLHRASGLWVWAMLFVFAWSSVAFNLGEVYSPVMKTLFAMRAEVPEMARRDKPLEQPALDWRAAHAAGQRLLAAKLARHGQHIEHEEYLFLDRDHGAYVLGGTLKEDIGRGGGVSVTFDADTGALHEAVSSADEKVGDTVTRWLVMLHMAAVGGIAMQVFVCAMGIVIAGLGYTGVVVWLRKRKGEQAMRAKRGGSAFVAAAPRSGS